MVRMPEPAATPAITPVEGATMNLSDVTFPKASVIVSTYNRPVLLGRALASIYAQIDTFPSFEVIVIDDASDDAAAVEKVLRHWAFEFMQVGVSFRAGRLGENSGYQAIPK